MRSDAGFYIGRAATNCSDLIVVRRQMNGSETPPAVAVRYRELDPLLEPWAKNRRLHLVKEHRDNDCRSMSIVDDAGDSYEIWVAPDSERQGVATVGVSLSKRGSKRHHAFHRERQQFSFQQSVPITELVVGLDTCWERVHKWIAEAGHARTPA
jgi:hypothetical protein